MSVDVRFAIRSPKGHPAGSALYDIEPDDEMQGWIDAGVAIVMRGPAADVPVPATDEIEDGSDEDDDEA